MDKLIRKSLTATDEAARLADVKKVTRPQIRGRPAAPRA